MILNGASSTATSSFPYQDIGPVDYQHLNFVRTKETEYYYGTGSAANQLIATVEQTYDPSITFAEITGIMFLFFSVVGFFILKIRKMGK